jgi:hypothetical protein
MESTAFSCPPGLSAHDPFPPRSFRSVIHGPHEAHTRCR